MFLAIEKVEIGKTKVMFFYNNRSTIIDINFQPLIL